MSDHSPIILVTHEDAQSTSLSLHILESIQTYEQLNNMIEHLWMGLTWQIDSYFQTLTLVLQQVSTLMRDQASSCLAATREAERRLHWTVAALQTQIEQHPSSEWTRFRLI